MIKWSKMVGDTGTCTKWVQIMSQLPLHYFVFDSTVDHIICFFVTNNVNERLYFGVISGVW